VAYHLSKLKLHHLKCFCTNDLFVGLVKIAIVLSVLWFTALTTTSGIFKLFLAVVHVIRMTKVTDRISDMTTYEKLLHVCGSQIFSLRINIPNVNATFCWFTFRCIVYEIDKNDINCVDLFLEQNLFEIDEYKTVLSCGCDLSFTDGQ
jgi:hypothetical protein